MHFLGRPFEGTVASSAKLLTSPLFRQAASYVCRNGFMLIPPEITRSPTASSGVEPHESQYLQTVT